MERCTYTSYQFSILRHYWDLVVILFVVYTVIVLPVGTAFYWTEFQEVAEEAKLTGWVVIDIINDFFFLFDIILNFNTGITKEPDAMVIMDRLVVTKTYLRTWFFLDLLSSFPLDLTLRGNRIAVWRLPRLIRLFRLSRLLRLLRFSRLIRYVERFQFFQNMSTFHVRMSKLIVVGMVFLHWNSCIQFLVSAAADFPEDTWVRQIQNAEDNEGILYASIFTQYSWSLFNALSHMLCIGYGQWPPQNIQEVWTVIISMTSGASLFAIFVGILVSLLIQLDAASSAYNQKMDTICQYMKHRNLPSELRTRIRAAYEYQWSTRRVMDEVSILNELPGSLRTQVCLFTCRDLIESVPFFEDSEEGFILSIVTLLEPNVFLADDVIVSEGEMSREMFFIRAGEVQVEKNGKPVTVLKSGSYFGEVGLIKHSKRTATVRALVNCELFRLTKKDFDQLIDDYPEQVKAMELIANHRLNQLKSSQAYKEEEEKKQKQKQQRRESNVEAVAHALQIIDDKQAQTTAPKSSHPLAATDDGDELNFDDDIKQARLNNMMETIYGCSPEPQKKIPKKQRTFSLVPQQAFQTQIRQRSQSDFQSTILTHTIALTLERMDSDEEK